QHAADTIFDQCGRRAPFRGRLALGAADQLFGKTHSRSFSHISRHILRVLRRRLAQLFLFRTCPTDCLWDNTPEKWPTMIQYEQPKDEMRKPSLQMLLRRSRRNSGGWRHEGRITRGDPSPSPRRFEGNSAPRLEQWGEGVQQIPKNNDHDVVEVLNRDTR